MLRGKPNTFPPRLQNSFLILTFPTVALCQLGPSLLQAQRILPQTRWEPLGKRAIVSWEGLRLGGCEETWGFGIPSQPIPPGKTFLEGGPSVCESITWLSWRNISECTQQRKLHPQRGDQPSDMLTGFQYKHHKKPAHCSPAEKVETRTCKTWSSLGTRCFFVASFLKVFHLPTFFVPILCPWAHSTTPGKLCLHTHAPCLFGARTQGKTGGVSLSGA